MFNTFLSNLKKACFDRETVTIGRGEFDHNELTAVFDEITALRAKSEANKYRKALMHARVALETARNMATNAELTEDDWPHMDNLLRAAIEAADEASA